MNEAEFDYVNNGATGEYSKNTGWVSPAAKIQLYDALRNLGYGLDIFTGLIKKVESGKLSVEVCVKSIKKIIKEQRLLGVHSTNIDGVLSFSMIEKERVEVSVADRFALFAAVNKITYNPNVYLALLEEVESSNVTIEDCLIGIEQGLKEESMNGMQIFTRSVVKKH